MAMVDVLLYELLLVSKVYMFMLRQAHEQLKLAFVLVLPQVLASAG